MRNLIVLVLFALVTTSTFSQTAKVSPLYAGYKMEYLGNSDGLRYYTYYKGSGGDFNTQIVGLSEGGSEEKKLTLVNTKTSYINAVRISDGKITCIVSESKSEKYGTVYTKAVVQEYSISTGKPIGTSVDLLSKLTQLDGGYVIDYFGNSHSENHEWSLVRIKTNEPSKIAVLVFDKHGEVKTAKTIDLEYNEKGLYSLYGPKVSNNGDVYFAYTANIKGEYKYSIGRVAVGGASKVQRVNFGPEMANISLGFDKGSPVITYTIYGKDAIYVTAYGFFKFDSNLNSVAEKKVAISASAGNAMGENVYVNKKAVPYLNPIGTYFRSDGSAVVVTGQGGVHNSEYASRPTSGGILLFVLSPNFEEKKVKFIKKSQEGTASNLGCDVLQQGDDLLIFHNTSFKPAADLQADFVVRKLVDGELSEPKVLIKDSPRDVNPEYHFTEGNELYFYTTTEWATKPGIVFIKL